MKKLHEPLIIVNGIKLSSAQSIAIRCAVSSYLSELLQNGLGDDEQGKAIASAYIERLKEIEQLINKSN